MVAGVCLRPVHVRLLTSALLYRKAGSDSRFVAAVRNFSRRSAVIGCRLAQSEEQYFQPFGRSFLQNSAPHLAQAYRSRSLRFRPRIYPPSKQRKCQRCL